MEILMEMKLDTALQNLHCITPTDPSGTDEPYLWIFHVVADGATVRQRLDDPLRLSANIVVHTGSGRPGNLNEAKASSAANIHIPEPVGRYQSSVKPIVLDLPFGTPPLKVFIPGRLVIICAAIDEEAVPRDAMEAAFNAVKMHVQSRLNDFFNSMSMTDFATPLTDPTDPIGAASDLFNERLATVISQISDEAPTIADNTATDWVWDHLDWNPISWFDGVAALLDKDEPIGNHTFTLDEAGIIGRSLHEVLQGDLRQPHISLSGAWYVVNGYGNAMVRFFPGDHKLRQLPEVSRPLSLPERHKLLVQRECVEAGTIVVVQHNEHFQKWRTIVNYPFMPYKYTLDGHELVGDGGTIQISKTVKFPEFDENKFYFVGAREEARLVTIAYERSTVPGSPQLHMVTIGNDPADGNFDLLLAIDGLLPSGSTVPVAEENLSFVGQTIDFLNDFLKDYNACVAHTLKEKWVRVKPSIPDHWRTPEAAWHQYQEIVKQLAEFHSLRIYDARTVGRIKQGIAAKLKLEVPE
jgi:hypothetical protein